MLSSATTCRVLAVLTAIMLLVGCHRTSGDKPYAPAEERLLKIGDAYVNASRRLGRPPANFDELKPDLVAGEGSDPIRSPGDVEEFIIHWGMDCNAVPPVGGDPFTIAAYERTGKSGRRYVLRFPRSVVLMNADELRKASFPPGAKPMF